MQKVYIAENLRRFRIDMGITISEFARRIGINRPAYASYEENRARPPLETMAVIMNFHEIPAEDMYDFIYDDKYTPEWTK